MVAHTFSPSTWEVVRPISEFKASSDLLSEFQASLREDPVGMGEENYRGWILCCAKSSCSLLEKGYTLVGWLFRRDSPETLWGGASDR